MIRLPPGGNICSTFRAGYQALSAAHRGANDFYRDTWHSERHRPARLDHDEAQQKNSCSILFDSVRSLQFMLNGP